MATSLAEQSVEKLSSPDLRSDFDLSVEETERLLRLAMEMKADPARLPEGFSLRSLSTFGTTGEGKYMINRYLQERGDALDPESIANVFEAVGTSDLTPKLPAYTSPTLIVNGEHDSALKGGTLTASLIRRSEHFILPGAGHCCFVEKPAEFNARVKEFFVRNGLWP